MEVQPITIKCMMCNETKPVDKFSLNQRIKKRNQKCNKCLNRPDDFEEGIPDSNTRFIRGVGAYYCYDCGTSYASNEAFSKNQLNSMLRKCKLCTSKENDKLQRRAQRKKKEYEKQKRQEASTYYGGKRLGADDIALDCLNY